MFHRIIFSVQKDKMEIYFAISVFICSIGSYSVYRKKKMDYTSPSVFFICSKRLIFSVQKEKMDYTSPSVFSYVPKGSYSASVQKSKDKQAKCVLYSYTNGKSSTTYRRQNRQNLRFCRRTV